MREIDESRTRAGGPLDELVVTMEITLISIIQGVALTFLVESSHGVLIGLQIEFWPYVVRFFSSISGLIEAVYDR